MLNQKHCMLILALVLLPGSRPPAATPSETDGLLHRAIELADIRATDMPPYRLAASLRIWTSDKPPLDGKYLLLRDGNGKWREEIVLPGYTRVRTGDTHNFWQERFMNFEPLLVFDLEALLDPARTLRREEKNRFAKPHAQKKDGLVSTCVQAAAAPGHEESLCFDSSGGNLVSLDTGLENLQSDYRIARVEYSDFQEFAGKLFPRTLRGYARKNLVAEIHVDELKEDPHPDPKYFVPAEKADLRLYCSAPPSSKLNRRVQPQYPVSAGENHLQGVVTFFALIEEDGSLAQIHLIHSAGPVLDQAALDAISQWTYTQPLCEGKPAPLETAIDVIFTLQR